MEELKEISKLQLMELQTRLLDQQVQLKVSASLIKFISDKSFDPAQGARFVRKNIQELLEDPLAEKIISGEAKPGSLVNADVKKDKVVFAVKKPVVEKVAVPV
jgi:ATP-dependent Clp protease ATP-binding subunit ClpB